MKWNENSLSWLIACGVRVTFGVWGDKHKFHQTSLDRNDDAVVQSPLVSPELKGPSRLSSLLFFFFFCVTSITLTTKQPWSGGGTNVAVLSPVGLSYMSVVHLNPSLQKKTRKKQNKNNIPTFVEGTKKNHFVSLTFVACFYFLIVGVIFFFFLFYEKRGDSVSVLFNAREALGMHWWATLTWL